MSDNAPKPVDVPEASSVEPSRDNGRNNRNNRFKGNKRYNKQDHRKRGPRSDGDNGEPPVKKVDMRKPRELQEGEVREPRKPKRKVACMIGYCGTGYHGMQVNPPHKTIEGDLFDAFVKAGAISKDNADDPKKSSFVRAARTDKGVHAGGNVVSLKLIIEDADIVDRINSHLPDTIRMWGFFRTNKAFECRKMCTSRIYEYMIPSYSFLPPRPTSALSEKVKEAKEQLPGVSLDDEEGEKFWADVEVQLKDAGFSNQDFVASEVDFNPKAGENSAEKTEEKPETDAASVEAREITIRQIKAIENQAKRAYRIADDRLARVREAFKVYEGSHNFHNFTIGKDFKDPSALRFMKTLDVSDPKIINGTEWLSIKIHGQSFMLHQIRKMVAMAALVVRTGCPLDRIREAFTSAKINIPKAPSLGLLLERPVYDGYNSRLEEFGYEPLAFDEWEEKMEAFKMKHIYDKIYSEEAKENVFNGFFGFIDSFRGEPIFDYLTARGISASTGKAAAEINIGDDEDELEGDIEG